jgi:hypothetical protein
MGAAIDALGELAKRVPAVVVDVGDFLRAHSEVAFNQVGGGIVVMHVMTSRS